MVTDPPYGVNDDPEWRNAAGTSATMRAGTVANDDRAGRQGALLADEDRTFSHFATVRHS